jgi:hypothetical protein
MWSVLTYLASAGLGKGGESILEVEHPQGRFCYPQWQGDHENDDWWEETYNLTSAFNCGVGANIRHTVKFLSMAEVKFSVCGQKSLPTDLTGNQSPGPSERECNVTSRAPGHLLQKLI